MINPGPENDKIAGQHVTVFDYPDGRFKIRYEGRELPYSVFDRLSQIRQADIVNNNRLGATLAMARDAQLESNDGGVRAVHQGHFPAPAACNNSMRLAWRSEDAVPFHRASKVQTADLCSRVFCTHRALLVQSASERLTLDLT